ncbi:MAG: hypothetical protein C4536_00300 [Actinobacteria bacterium]|jgi:hypothetical protein|nr:MAG: hypothetical protein C4536_00300 [Actinomycetota bacterium]
MDKGKKGLALAVALCITMTALCCCGCGSGGAARLENPLDFFNQARANMQTVASFRMSGEMLMELSGVPGMGAINVDYDMVCEQKSDGETLAKMDMRMEGPPSMDMQMYITEDRMYMEMPGGLWVYQEADFSSNMMEMNNQTMGPQYVMDMLDMAESAEVVGEDDDTITYDLVLDYDKIMQGQELELEKLQEELEKQGLREEDFHLFLDFMRDVIAGLEMQMTVEKESGLATRFRMHMEMDFSYLAALSPDEAMPEGAGMTMDADFEVSDYGKAFNIQLPDEAAEAIPVEELETLSET